MEENFAEKKSFFKSPGGVVTIVLLIILGLVAAIFLGFFGYYLWAQKYAAPEAKEKIVERFEPKFTRAPGKSNRTTATNKDIKTFIQPSNPKSGKVDAPVTILVFMDFECQSSQKSFPILEEMKQKYGSTVQVVFKHFPIEIIHQEAKRAAIAAQCAQNKNIFWPYASRLFQKPNVGQDMLLLTSNEIGVNLEDFSKCMSDPAIDTIVNKDIDEALALGVEGTPTFFINQKKVEGVVDMATWDSLIVEELQKKQ